MTSATETVTAGRSRTTPHSFVSIKGYPDRLQLYLIDASPFWQVRVYSGGRYKRNTTGIARADKKEAEEFAKAFYEQVLTAEWQDKSLFPNSFGTMAKEYLASLERLVRQDRIQKRKYIEEKRKLTKDLIPFFGEEDIAEIKTRTIQRYLDEVLYERKLSISTIKKHLITLGHVLSYAKREEKLKHLPDMPKIDSKAKKQKPRGYFKEDEYRKLYRTAIRWGNKKETRRVKYGETERILYYTREFSDFIVFAANVFVRTSDLLPLKHRMVSITAQEIKGKTVEVLEISSPNPKTLYKVSVSMPRAAVVYRRLLERHKEEGLGVGSDDFIFYPEYENRQTALDNLSRLMHCMLTEIGLKRDAFDTDRTLYSLRHTALMYRFLYMEPADIYLIAKNALSSVEMMEKFYLSHSDTRTKIEQLISSRKNRG
jgi:hypothetical protein